ncbi:hypothetical protein KI387_013258 [Taxus chinensis]|uniref:non-specific serine/threonine protein kinase n=1 Tax=Taxus chinensis TaxID=29808 RepID=A0AA38FGP0_TAXCH|nr:hypothetical protein KI387_013258 [Taxus chinensis]
MWRLKQLMPSKEQGGGGGALEGKTVEVGSLKLQVRSTIAEGGFSCVYLAVAVGRDREAQGKQYAVKHIICNDGESLDLVKKEVAVMRALRGHPNVVRLHAQTVYDLGRTKECFLVLEFCDKALVNVLDNRGAAYFDETHILLIFRDLCNAVCAMHSQSPPIAHRDLKAENVLMGADGLWKLCDFGSTSTNHKRFERPEEMGIEEDIIRKHTTPAYRAPEMWDLYRKELISEKVDVWALGCLLYRIAFLKSAFDGESKLQILNGNYRIPELPRYSSSLTDLIKDMLIAAPEARPDIMQIWRRVNELLPFESRKSNPDRPSSTATSEVHVPPTDARDHGIPVPTWRATLQPSRSPPHPPSSKEQDHRLSPVVHLDSKAVQGSNSGSALGAFWSTQYAKESVFADEKGPVFDKDSGIESAFKQMSHSPDTHAKQDIASPSQEHPSKKKEFDYNKATSGTSLSGGENLQAEVDRLKEELEQLRIEKTDITSKYEKLTAICRSQRQEIHELKQAISTGAPQNFPIFSKDQRQHSVLGSLQSGSQQQHKIEGSIWELQESMTSNNLPTRVPDAKGWQAFAEAHPSHLSRSPPSVARISSQVPGGGHANINNTKSSGQASSQDESRGNPAVHTSNSSKSVGRSVRTSTHSQPAGWAGF